MKQFFAAALTCLVLAAPESALAEVAVCDVLVRVLQGTDEGGGLAALPNTVAGDVRAQLEPLPFTSYSVLDSRHQLMPLGHEARFSLSGHEGQRHQLRVVPHDFAENKVGVTVTWHGPANEELLSTKLRVANGKCVVLGTDGKNAATILAVKLECSLPRR